jgi:uncharacterized protein YegP (UPF0339 family)
MKFELYTSAGLWYWRLRAANHEIIAQGEGYQNKQDARHAVHLVMDTSRETRLIELPAS